MTPSFLAISFHWMFDTLDILIVAIFLYQLYKLVRKSNVLYIFIGILSIYFIWLFVDNLGMKMLSKTLGQFMDVGVIALIIVFQQEIRKFLVVLGRKSSRFTTSNPFFAKLLHSKNKGLEKKLGPHIHTIANACFEMGRTLTGAIIIIKRNNQLNFYAETGEALNATISGSLITSIFYKNSPLHDGAIIIEGNKIVAARCVLPVTDKEEFPIELGMRHRAAVGISEQTDAIAIIVSEQSGNVSISANGKLFLDLNKSQFIERMQKLLD